MKGSFARRPVFGALGLLLGFIVIGSVIVSTRVGNAAPPPASARMPLCAAGDRVAVLTRTRVPGALVRQGARGTPGTALRSFLTERYPGLEMSQFRPAHQAASRVQFELLRAGRIQMFIDVDTFTGSWSVAEMSACNRALTRVRGTDR
jgi:hypothetical protein